MEKGPDLPQEFIVGGSVYDIEPENWILLGGSVIAGKTQYSNTMRYNCNGKKFERFPSELKIGRSGFGALMYQVSDKC